jgi:DNA-binding NarL/FixJ family response regulator
MAGNSGACGRILVVDDDAGVRRLVCSTLEEAGFSPLAAGDAAGALAAASGNVVDLAIVDVNLPRVSGYELCRRLKEARSTLPVIFVSGVRTEWYDRVGGLLLGADDYLLKPFVLDELVARVRCLLRRAGATVPASLASLTKRELEVLRLLALGGSQREIAADLVISPRTVGTHIEHILEKLGVRSRSQAIALAYRERLLEPAARG